MRGGGGKGEGEGSRFVCHFSKGLLFTDVLPVLVPFYRHHATICTLKSLYLPYIRYRRYTVQICTVIQMYGCEFDVSCRCVDNMATT
jgi:hypothetical protein